MKLSKPNKETATAIILVISILATLMVIAAVAAEYTMTIGSSVDRSNTFASAIAIADGCLDNNFAYWRKICRTPGKPTPTTNALKSITLPTQAQFPDVSNFKVTRNTYSPTATQMVQQYKVVAVDPELQNVAVSATPVPDIGQGTATYNYRASAYVTLPSLRGKVIAKVERIFQEQQISPWNYAIFYNDPLEIHPGPQFDVTGWVHTNSDLYTGHNTLHFQDKATFSGEWYRSTSSDPLGGFMPGDKQHLNPSDPADGSPTWPMNPERKPDFDSSHQPFNLDPETFDIANPPANPNNTGYHELIEVPDPSAPDPMAGSRYYDQADIRILIDGSNNLTITKQNGTVLNGSSKGNDGKMYDSFVDAITTNQTIQDNREQAQVRLTTLDIGKLFSAPGNSGGMKNFGGIIYITDTSANPNGVGAKRGIRLVNGSVIPQNGTGLTIASGNPVYIQGDYNTGSNPPSNSGDPTTPQAPDYTRQPCSVIADAVNILSNAWDDNKAGTVPTASPTTINAAIVSGIVATADPGGDGHYSGGAENFPRFLENWNNKTLTYYGSMVELYHSQQSIGVWGKPSVYDAPTRKWYFDTDFRIKPPPGTLMTYTYTKGRWSVVQ